MQRNFFQPKVLNAKKKKKKKKKKKEKKEKKKKSQNWMRDLNLICVFVLLIRYAQFFIYKYAV